LYKQGKTGRVIGNVMKMRRGEIQMQDLDQRMEYLWGLAQDTRVEDHGKYSKRDARIPAGTKVLLSLGLGNRIGTSAEWVNG
jgi:hypothetical protein